MFTEDRFCKLMHGCQSGLSSKHWLSAMAGLALWCVLFVGCGGRAADAGQPVAPTMPVKPRPKVSSKNLPAALPSSKLTGVPAGTFGPYLARSEGRGVLVWAEPAGPNATSFFSMPLDQMGASAGDKVNLGVGEGTLERFAIKPVRWKETGPGGFVAISSSKLLKNDGQVRYRLEFRRLNGEGGLLGDVRVVGEGVDPAYWLDCLDLEGGPLLMWANKQGKAADIAVLKLDTSGANLIEPRAIVRDAKAWQVAALDDGALLAAVKAHVGKESTGTVEAVRLDGDGKRVGDSVIIQSAPSAGFDLDLRKLKNNLAVAWSDSAKGDPRVVWALLDQRGKVVRAPEPLAGPGRLQQLLRLVAAKGSDRAFAIWEEQPAKATGSRELYLRALHDGGGMGDNLVRLEASLEGGADFEAQASEDGVLLLVPVSSCPEAGACENGLQVTAVKLGSDLELQGQRSLIIGQGSVAVSLAWNLECDASGCVALVAEPKAPAPIHSVLVEAEEIPAATVYTKLDPNLTPRLDQLESLSTSGAPVFGMDFAGADDASLSGLLSWVTDFDSATPYEKPEKPAPDGRMEPVRALLSVVSISAAGTVAKPNIISYRAHSPGGVALAPAPGGGALLVWTALDGGTPQVFATLLDARGNRVSQRMVTRKAQVVGDVAVAYADGGWVLAWVDERDGDKEVYATKVNRALMNMAAETRVTSIPGAAESPALALLSKSLILAWLDGGEPRNPREAAASTAPRRLYTARLDSATLAIKGEAHQLSTVDGARSPMLLLGSKGMVLGFIQSTGAASAERDRLALGKVSLEGEVSELRFQGLDGRIKNFAFDCIEAACRAVALVESSEERKLVASVFGEHDSLDVAGEEVAQAHALLRGEARTVKTKPLLTLPGAVQGQGSLILKGATCLFAEGHGEGSRVRRARIEW